MELDERKRKILTAIIEIHVKTGEPVGSKVISENLDISISPATIRNEMSELTELGFLEQPHTSAGRIPSNRGYREYVNNLMRPDPISDEERRYIYGNLSASADDPGHLLEQASGILARLTNFAAISKAPKNDEDTVRYIQFVITARCAGMLIMMTSSGAIKNRNFKTDYSLTPEIIRIYQGVFNEKFGGIPLTSVTPAFIQSIARSLGEYSSLLRAPLIAFMAAAREALNSEIRLKGQVNLLYLHGLEMKSARRILDFLNEEENVSKLLNVFEDNDDMKIFIGNENDNPELNDSTVAIARYDLGKDNNYGAIALVGPTRMNYARNIGSLKFLAQSLGDILSDMLITDIED